MKQEIEKDCTTCKHHPEDRPGMKYHERICPYISKNCLTATGRVFWEAKNK